MQECIPLSPLVGNIEHVPTCIINSVHGTENWCVEDNFNTLQRSVPNIEAVKYNGSSYRYVQS